MIVSKFGIQERHFTHGIDRVVYEIRGHGSNTKFILHSWMKTPVLSTQNWDEGSVAFLTYIPYNKNMSYVTIVRGLVESREMYVIGSA